MFLRLNLGLWRHPLSPRQRMEDPPWRSCWGLCWRWRTELFHNVKFHRRKSRIGGRGELKRKRRYCSLLQWTDEGKKWWGWWTVDSRGCGSITFRKWQKVVYRLILNIGWYNLCCWYLDIAILDLMRLYWLNVKEEELWLSHVMKEQD